MANKRMCPQSVMLKNYVGEVAGVATYATTYLHNVKFIIYRGVSTPVQGRGESDTAKLYIFDDILFAADDSGTEVQYLPHEEWVQLEDKSGYWTLSLDGDDFIHEVFYDIKETGSTIVGEAYPGVSFVGEGKAAPHYGTKFRIKGVKRLKQGSRRLWHFEVDCG